jgi:arginase
VQQSGARPKARSAFAIVEAPSVLGLFPRGVERLPDALLAVGIAERLQARRAGRVEPPPYDERRDPETLLLNPQGIADYSVALADSVGRVVDAEEFPVVLGGDCSIMLGCMLAPLVRLTPSKYFPVRRPKADLRESAH